MAGRTLGGVPETALWTLRNRAEEAMRPGSYLDDPEAVRLYRTLREDAAEDFDRFGKPSQSHPLRALTIDRAVRDFLAKHPRGPVVALGEGLQTTYWRLSRPDVAWYSIDLPEMIEVQRRLLPAEDAITRIPRSALDRAWLDEVPPGPAIVTAEGLFMYLPKDEVHALIADLAAHFPGGRLIYDSIPAWFSKMATSGKVKLSDRYVAPVMPTSQTVSEAARLPRLIPGVASARDVMLPRGRGRWASPALRVVSNAPWIRDVRPNITLLTFADDTGGTTWAQTRDGRSLHAVTAPGPVGSETLPTVVFEAGAAADRSSWAAVRPLVAAFAGSVAYDRSGLGRSAPDPAGRTLTRMADDLNDLLDHLDRTRGGGRYVLVGHSAGGPIVRLAASRRPDRVAGLVLVDPTDEAAEVLFGARFRRTERVAVAAGGLLARAGLLKHLYRRLYKDAPPDVRADMLAESFTPQVMATAREQARTFLDELATWRATSPELGDIPVTVISGALAGDGMNGAVRAAANTSHAHRAAQSPHGRHVLARRSSHYVPLTDPDVIAAEVRRLVAPAP